MIRGERYGMSIVLVTDSASRVAAVIDTIRRAASKGAVEIVVVCPHDVSGSLDSDVKVVAVSSVYPLASARAAGIIGASGRYVFIGETHSFPRPGMFDALLTAHNVGGTVAVPAFENENPATLVSWAGFINGYAPWSVGRSGGMLSYGPLFNVSYDRDFLVGLGDILGNVLTSGEDLMSRIKSVKGRVMFEPDAVIGHVNIARLDSWLAQRIVAGRVIASVRSASWTIPRRLMYAIAFPLIPFVLMYRHRSSIARTVRTNGVSSALWPLLFLGMIFQAYGEAIGYALGRDEKSERRYDEYEIEQMNYA
ncbi:MAG TPA: hypothetical protein VF042_05060 [Gemmatimonadaceae bacterium]